MSGRVVAIAGGSGSGKTSLALALVKAIGEDRCLLLAQDDYYHDQSKKFDGDGGSVNFDHPDATDFSLMSENIKDLVTGKRVEIPQYDFVTHTRKPKPLIVEPKDIIVLDGILLLANKTLTELFNVSIFVDVPEGVRFSRRKKRDIEERGRSVEGIENQLKNQVRPMHNQFVEPFKGNVDLLVNGESSIADNVQLVLPLLN